jgi:type IV fimbrial biogenesis protein FimT
MKSNQHHGFTILELLITLTIASVVLVMAGPPLKQFIQSNRLTSYRNALVNDIGLARSKSLERNLPSVVCVSSDGANCTNGSFQEGWITVLDTDSDGNVSNADELLKVQNPLDGDISFYSDVGSKVEYDGRGFNAGVTGNISVCDDRGVDSALVISISTTGRVSRGGNPSCS